MKIYTKKKKSYKAVILENVSSTQQCTLQVGYLHLPRLKDNMQYFGYPKNIKFVVTPKCQWKSNTNATMYLKNLRQDLLICKQSAV